MEIGPHDTYTVYKIPVMRRFSLDNGRMSSRRNFFHALLEVDVTEPRRLIREHKARSGEAISFTAFIVYCLGQALEVHKELTAFRDWRGRLIVFDDVNINTMVEAESQEGKFAMPHIIRGANRRTLRQIHAEIRVVQSRPAKSQEAGFMRTFLRLPGFLRVAFYEVVMRRPQLMRGYLAPVLVTAVGMFGEGGGWGLPMAVFPLSVTLGGIAKKPWAVGERIELREVLDATLSFDHVVVDGANAARFGGLFRRLVEEGAGLEDIEE